VVSVTTCCEVTAAIAIAAALPARGAFPRAFRRPPESDFFPLEVSVLADRESPGALAWFSHGRATHLLKPFEGRPQTAAVLAIPRPRRGAFGSRVGGKRMVR
jgi:hypothetical protein